MSVEHHFDPLHSETKESRGAGYFTSACTCGWIGGDHSHPAGFYADGRLRAEEEWKVHVAGGNPAEGGSSEGNPEGVPWSERGGG